MTEERQGSQRLPVEKLEEWQGWGLGLFLHFGMSTFDGDPQAKGDKPSAVYAPDKLDVGQWISVARDAGMKYAILTAKHIAGHALWPTKHGDYHVGTSGNTTDVVEEFVTACEARGVLPGLYYCSWDNHNRFGSRTPAYGPFETASTTQEYREFQMRQMEELLTQYGKIAEVWIDIPNVLGQDGRSRQYEQIARLQPEAVIMMNAGFTHGDKLDTAHCWPTDILAIERGLPCAPMRRTERFFGYDPWWKVGDTPEDEKDYYIPGEVCDTLGWTWFYRDGAAARTDLELLGMYLVSRARGCNFLLDVPPNRQGLIPRPSVDSLMRLRKNIDRTF